MQLSCGNDPITDKTEMKFKTVTTNLKKGLVNKFRNKIATDFDCYQFNDQKLNEDINFQRLLGLGSYGAIFESRKNSGRMYKVKLY